MSTAIKPKHQRLVLVLAALAALIAAALLAAWALRNQASYFYLPAEMASKPPAADRAVRLGGMVDTGSLKTAPDGVTIATDYNGWYRPDVPPMVATMNHAHTTHYTLTPEPEIQHVLHGWQSFARRRVGSAPRSVTG